MEQSTEDVRAQQIIRTHYNKMEESEANDNGLKICKETFLKMKMKDQLGILFDNQLVTIELIRSYKLNQKIVYGAITILFICAGYFMIHVMGG